MLQKFLHRVQPCIRDLRGFEPRRYFCSRQFPKHFQHRLIEPLPVLHAPGVGLKERI
jgi:hypothetical protein